MRKIINNRLSLLAFLLLSCFFVGLKNYQIRDDKHFFSGSSAIGFDVYGYYLHLPAVIIHHDVGIVDRTWVDALNAKYQKNIPFYQVVPGINHRMVNIYPTGLAICNLPFFLVAHISAGWFGYARDGLSTPYQIMIIIAGLFYGIMGMWLLRKILLRFFSDKLSAIVLLAIGLGTNLYYYATYDCPMPHITLFCLDTLILLLTIKWHASSKPFLAIALGLLIGLVTITRPSEIVWILVPLLWGIDGWKAVKEKLSLFKKHFLQLLLFAAGMIAVGSIQLFYWKFTSGHWISNNHGEVFDFFRPFTIDVLFSYKKGWLLYTPMMILAIIGIFILYKRNRKLFVPIIVFFLANLWFISSWECWWYAASFGQRPFVESYGLMALPLGFFLQAIAGNKIRIIISSIVILAISFLNQFQGWQLYRGILHYELTTKAYYWKVFCRVHPPPDSRKYLEVERYLIRPLDEMKDQYVHKKILSIDFENPPIKKNYKICDTLGFDSEKSEVLDIENIFSPGLRKSFDSLTWADYIRVRFSADVFLSPDFMSKPTYVIFHMFSHAEHTYGYTSVKIDSTMAHPGEWCRIHANYITPVILHRDDKLWTYIWNAGGSRILVDNIEVEVYEPK